MRDDFAIFICTHGRPDKQLTLETLMRTGYTGKWFLVVDDTDATIQQYIDNFGSDKIIIFDKNYYINSDRFDNGDNKLHAKCILYAKRAVEDIAKSFNLRYFVIADDDITNLVMRVPLNDKLRRIPIENLDNILECHLQILSDNITAIGFGNVVHYFGGVNTFSQKNLNKRILPYQFIIRNANVDVNWLSWFAEDDVTEYQSSMIGGIWLISLYVMLEIKPVGDIEVTGGMVDTYKESANRYELNFNAVKYCPERLLLKYAIKTGKFELKRHPEICFPKIINARYKK